MEKHFLSEFVEGEPTFRAEPWYNPHGDCLVFQMVDEAVVAHRIDEVLTIYRSALDDRPIGFQIKGVQAIVQTYGWEGLAVSHKTDHDSLKSVSIAAILLAAYEKGPKTVGRRRAYASVMECHPTTRTSFRAEELVPA